MRAVSVVACLEPVEVISLWPPEPLLIALMAPRGRGVQSERAGEPRVNPRCGYDLAMATMSPSVGVGTRGCFAVGQPKLLLRARAPLPFMETLVLEPPSLAAVTAPQTTWSRVRPVGHSLSVLSRTGHVLRAIHRDGRDSGGAQAPLGVRETCPGICVGHESSCPLGESAWTCWNPGVGEHLSDAGAPPTIPRGSTSANDALVRL